MQHKINVKLSPELKARLQATNAKTPSARIRDGIDCIDELIERGLIDLTSSNKNIASIHVRLSERQHAIVVEAAARVGLRPHQLVLRLIQYLAR